MGMVATAYLLVIKLLAHCQVNFVIDFTSFLKILSLGLILDIDLLHSGPQGALGSHGDLIGFQLIAQPEQLLSVGCTIEVPAVLQAEAHHFDITMLFQELCDATFSGIHLPNEASSVSGSMLTSVVNLLLKPFVVVGQLSLEHGVNLFHLFGGLGDSFRRDVNEVLVIHLHVRGVILSFSFFTSLKVGVNLNGHFKEVLVDVEVIEEVFELEVLIVIVLTSQVEGCRKEVLGIMNSFSKTQEHRTLTATRDIPPGILMKELHPRSAKINFSIELRKEDVQTTLALRHRSHRPRCGLHAQPISSGA